MVEFALLAPVALLLIFGLIVIGLIVVNEVGLSNATRDIARAAGVCGGSGRDPNTRLPDTGFPVCSQANLQTYINNRLKQLVGGDGSSVTIKVYKSTDRTKSNDLLTIDNCDRGGTIEISATFQQPLFLPLVGHWLATSPSTTDRTLNADASATCEQ